MGRVVGTGFRGVPCAENPRVPTQAPDRGTTDEGSEWGSGVVVQSGVFWPYKALKDPAPHVWGWEVWTEVWA